MATTSSRLLLLLSLLQTRRDWPGQHLADRLDVSQRTVRRDVDRLREMGYHIQAIMGPDGGYRLDAGAQLPPLLFDDDQVVALTVALQAATAAGVGIEESAVRALTTVRQVMPARLRHRIDSVRFTALPRHRDTTSPEVLIALTTAIRAREALRFDYSSSTGQARRVEPHHLVTTSGRWYLVAWDLDRNHWRIFRADRLTPRTPTGPRFTPREIPGGDVQAFVSASFRGSTHGDAWPCIGTVILGLPAGAVRPFTEDGTVEELGPSRCRVEAGSWSWPALASSFGRFDTDIEVVGPPELAAAFEQLARRYAAAAVTVSGSPRTGSPGRAPARGTRCSTG